MKQIEKTNKFFNFTSKLKKLVENWDLPLQITNRIIENTENMEQLVKTESYNKIINYKDRLIKNNEEEKSVFTNVETKDIPLFILDNLLETILILIFESLDK